MLVFDPEVVLKDFRQADGSYYFPEGVHHVPPIPLREEVAPINQGELETTALAQPGNRPPGGSECT